MTVRDATGRGQAASLFLLRVISDRSGSHEVIEVHGWTLERYGRLAQQVHSTPGHFERFQALVDARS
jgi:hypothetical protein